VPKAAPEPFDVAYGMSLIEGQKFDESARYFEKHLEKNATAHYGLALSKFRAAPASLSVADLRSITELFESAIGLSPAFPDAYFMCAMAYNQAAGLQLGSFNKNRPSTGLAAFQEPDAHLAKAESYFRKAVLLNPSFSAIAKQELDLNRKLTDFSAKLKGEL
jgi:tetratricopeptide (TPR) repeat protein